jgi:hypothetical protein
MKLIVQTIGICLSILAFWGKPVYGQGTTSNETLFQKLQSEQTASGAFEQFLKLGKKRPDVRNYLGVHLPEKIAAGPVDQGKVWNYEVELAGLLGIVEAIPSLIQHIDEDIPGYGVTLSSQERLADYPAGKALAQIGEPAVPALSSVLETGDYRKRWVASRALNLIEAMTATNALRKHLPNESDPKLREYIEGVLQRRRASSPN